MKRIVLALTVLFIMASCACADIEISAANFPDNNFRACIRSICDYDNDGILTDDDLAFPGDLDVSSQDISSLKGIEFFTGLNGLNCANNHLTGTLDLSSNTALKWFNCTNNKIESLNLTGCMDLEGVNCDENELTGTLDLSGRTNLIYITCGSNKLTGLNLTGCMVLEAVICNENELTGTLDLSGRTKLTYVNCRINKLTGLNLTGCMALESVDCRENELTGTLDLSGRTNLTYVGCRLNKLTGLNLTGCMNLENVNCRNNELTGTLDLSGRTALRELYCHRNHLESVNVTGCTALEYFNCGFNSRIAESHDNYVVSHGIETLDVSTCTALKELNCYNNSLLQIDVSKNLLLEFLNCEDNWFSGNSIKAIDVSNNTNLTYLNCAYNNIDVLDVSRNTKLVHLDCGNNNLHSLNLQNNTALEYLDIRGSYMTEIDLSRNTALKELYCFVNELQTLDLTRNTNLEVIECYRNSLSALNLAGHTALKQDEAVIKNQTVRELNISFDADNVEYPYSLNLNDYMASSQISGVIASTIKGLDDEDEEISSSYANGVIRFSEHPAKVKYNYGTGLGSLSMDVMITSGDTYTGMTSHNNHVYRIIMERITWPQAKEYCESLGGHLLTITSIEEHDVIERMLADAYHSELGVSYKYSSCFWIGGEKKNDSWYWITGEEVTDTDSSSRTGLPSTTADYLMITFMGNYAVPNASLQRRYFICEWDSVSLDSAPLSEQFTLWSDDPEAYYDGLEFYGEIPEPTDLSHLADNPPVMDSMVHDSAALPSQYDLRDYRHITSIRNQNPYGTCWAFASVGAIESNYLVQNNGGTVPDLSELHLAWYTFRDSRQGYSFPLNDTSESILNQGGWASMPIALFSRMSGPALESELPYSDAGRLSTLTSGRTPESYTRPLRLKEAYTIGSITANNRELVKTLVINHGAVMICYSHSGEALRGSSYYSTDKRTNHAVEIIGWDDNYSRNNFKNQPSSNGAWLVRNSWGTSWGDSGYFWMSYEQYIGDATVFIAEDTVEGLKHYGHDALGSISSISAQWSANIFKAGNDEDLIEIGFYTKDNNVPYEIYINILGSELPVNPGAVSSPVLSGTMPNAGYHTVTLSTPIELEKGEYFSVILKSGKSSSYAFVSAVESHHKSSGVRVNEGESYFASSNAPVSSDWTDGKRISGKPYNACVKAFTVPAGTDVISPSITTSSLPDGKVGETYSYTLTASGASPITWSVSGLPDGLSLSNATITGTPLSAGSYSVYVTAKNAAGSDSRTLSLRITSSTIVDGGRGGGGGGCDSFIGIYALLALSVCTFMKKR